MDILFSERNRHLIVTPVGEIDHHNSLTFRRSIEKAFARSGAHNMIFDFSRVDFMDSSGIGLLIGRYRELSKTGGKVYAANVGKNISKLFGVSGLAKIIPVFNSIDNIFEEIKGGK
ncbi:MAG: anti-sigma factor antagonist [Defluviitaleaceae bacterium]|nr:anti-sigma factor antagonist [Defluviitaleaceae bacterium]